MKFGQIQFTAPGILTGMDTRLRGRVGTQGGAQIYFGIWTNTFFNLDKYISQHPSPARTPGYWGE